MSRFLTFVILAALTTTAIAQDVETGRRASYVRTRTFQSLVWQPGIAGHYLAVDPKSGVPYLSPESSVEFSDSFWELRGVYKHRGYRAHVILQRGNNPLNDRTLGINPDTGEFIFTKGEVATSYWLIRYAGKYNGYDAYLIQTLAETPAGFDMNFVTVDPATKRIALTSKPEPGSYWHIAYTSDLPAETRQ